MSLIVDSGRRPAFSFTSAWNEHKAQASIRTCWASTLNRKLWNKRAALGLGALWKTPLGAVIASASGIMLQMRHKSWTVTAPGSIASEAFGVGRQSVSAVLQSGSWRPTCQAFPCQGVKESRLTFIARLWRPLARLPPALLFSARKDPAIYEVRAANRDFASPCSLSSGSSPPLAIVLHPVGRDAERSELKRAFCSSLSEL